MMTAAREAPGFKPPEDVARNAKQGLELREEFGRGGTAVGVRRARQLAAREDVTSADVKRVASYFARHEVDKRSKSHKWGDLANPSAGFIAWQLWGGDAGKKWSDSALKEIYAQEN